MDVINGLFTGFSSLMHLDILFYCFVGVFVGTLIGVLPGIGPVGAMSILLPSTFGLSPAASVVMLAGIYYGAMYGGSTTSILVNIPGEAASVVTCLDGYQMAKKGRAGPALGISALGSFIGGTIAIVLLMFLVFPLAATAVKFGPAEYFAVVCLSMTLLTYLSAGSVINSIIMIFFGLIIGCVGMDPIEAIPRFHFGTTTLLDGFGLVPVVMGLFGISEVLMNIANPEERVILKAEIRNLLPNLEDWKRAIAPILRGSVMGFFLGILPGGGAVMSTFLSYTVEKKLSKHPQDFGTGIIEGVAGPETANNAAAGGAFVPMLALGIPPNPIMALLLGALIIHGVNPGPLLVSQHPDIFWGVIASMYVGNAMLLVLNLPLVGMWIKILKVPYRLLMPLILLCCLVGSFATNNNVMDIVIMIAFGVIGYILRKNEFELAPFVLALILGPLMEKNFRNALIISDGSFMIFLTKPITATVLGISALILLSTCFSSYKKTKKRVIEEAGTGD
ncbi:MAG TPA: tripartite tricarboxylate transporter permease [Syntrophorhabdaceae bacterium]|nr:tripartite tricarboxylate transporter permease [Syntrophorhabdaceae bacterium]